MYFYLLFVIIGFLVLTSTIVMTIWFKTNRILNFYLIFTSIALCFYLILHGLNNCKLIKEYEISWNMNYYQIILILTPSVYLFFRNLIFNSKYPEKHDLLYFIIPALFSYYLSFVKFDHFFLEKVLVYIAFIIYTLFYCRKSYGILKRYVWQNDYYDVLTPIVKNWADFIFKMMVIVLIHFYVFFASQFFNVFHPINLALESSFLIVFLIGYFKVIFSPVLLYGSPKIEKISNTTNTSNLFIKKVWILESKIKINNPRDIQINNRINDKVFAYIEQIENVALVDYLFRKQDYSIYELSIELGLPKYYLEFIFKYFCKVSFNEYKKIVRIYDAVKLINEGYLSTNTLDTLSRHVGFASYNPFLINFKEILGISPFDYYKRRNIVRNKNIL